MMAAGPYQNSLAQPGSRRYQTTMADRARVALAQHENLFWVQLRNSVPVGLEVVDQKQMLDIERLGQRMAVQLPGQVGKAESPGLHRPGHAETGRRQLFASVVALGQKLRHHFAESGKLVGGILLVPFVRKVSVLEIIQSQVNLGASHVSGKNHRVISRWPLPSPSGAGSSAAAA